MGKSIVFVTHGHINGEDNPPPLKKGDILLHGHTHVQRCVPHDNFVYMNPGSVSLPKEDSVRGYMLWEDRCFAWKNLETGDTLMTYEAE
jgi:predicted phosphodiesterase